MKEIDYIWIFQGNQAGFPSAVFSTKEKALVWIETNKVSGILTEYPIDISVYEWTIEKDYFTPKKEHQKTPDFISRFSSTSLKHHHFKEGVLEV
ncbi:hypothetical protein MWN41_09170 [Ornithobacterium rhinotracheale]|uniref:DUF7710 domain-containing protein n=1 Tax=Ornithobacterium rhinotracheale TaxID=28251 RepID=UPI001FF45128|nr:hypothetical protein [Ornithobacterium rhinotracheale]MCK0203180.1 hypothetical protein [Ornithobacterium rhinotracheale]